ncbi:MAG: DUF1273 family protein [Clostridia bacterium]|nr:DUF1273 family protein [Clostridia bacterium]
MIKKLDFKLTACFTGHRIIAKEDLPSIKEKLRQAIDQCVESGITRFICGGALGFDTLAAQAVLEKKKTCPITLEIAVPCKDQDAKWTRKQQETYREILSQADSVTVLFEKYVTGCMHFRDAFMVDNSDVLIAYYRGKPGGTQYTFLYAESRGKKIIKI